MWGTSTWDGISSNRALELGCLHHASVASMKSPVSTGRTGAGICWEPVGHLSVEAWRSRCGLRTEGPGRLIAGGTDPDGEAGCFLLPCRGHVWRLSIEIQLQQRSEVKNGSHLLHYWPDFKPTRRLQERLLTRQQNPHQPRFRLFAFKITKPPFWFEISLFSVDHLKRKPESGIIAISGNSNCGHKTSSLASTQILPSSLLLYFLFSFW